MSDFVGEFDPEMLKTNNQIKLHDLVTGKGASSSDCVNGTAMLWIAPVFDSTQGRFVYDPTDWASHVTTISDVPFKLYKTNSDASPVLNFHYDITLVHNCHFQICYMNPDTQNPEVPKPPPSLCFGDLTVFYNCIFESIVYFGVSSAFSKTLISNTKYESSFEIGSPQSPSGISVKYKSPSGSDVLNPRQITDPTNMISNELKYILAKIAAAETDLYVPPSNLKS